MQDKMSLLTDLLFGSSAFNAYLFYAIVVTVITILYFAFIRSFFELIPFLDKIDSLLVLATLIFWGIYFFRNLTVNVSSNNTYLAVFVSVVLVVVVYLISRGKKK